MTGIDVIIVADDLTGALDSSAPFALRGGRVEVATGTEAIPAALSSGGNVIVVSTESRHLPPAEARDRVLAAGRLLRAADAPVVIKKVDSRLKGNAGVESAALAEALGRTRLIVAPAIPEQERRVRLGVVVGRGIVDPIDVARAFATQPLPFVVADAEDEADLDAVAERIDPARDLLVGARGIAGAVARRGRMASPVAPFARQAGTLFAIASRDPITAAQLAVLGQRGIAIADAPRGEIGRMAGAVLPLAIRATGDVREPPERVAARFAQGLMPLLARLEPNVLVLSGGDTAAAILREMGVTRIRVEGEALPGLPFFLVALPGGRAIHCVVKSGGFGSDETLARLLP